MASDTTKHGNEGAPMKFSLPGTLFLLFCLASAGPPAFAAQLAGDVDFSGQVNAVDVQLVINGVLGIPIDADNDGVPDNAETRLGTEPNNSDSDDDGVPDGQEVVDGTDPLVPDSGPKPVSVPNVVGMAQATAESTLLGVGLAAGTVAEQSSATVTAGKVISQNPSAGASALAGSTVSLVVSKGPQPVSTPDVVGLKQSVAQTTLTGVGLVVGTITEQFSAAVAVGKVISQSPLAGVSVAPGTAVNLSVSKGPTTLGVYYVRKSTPATPANQDGLSWSTAYADIQPAIEKAYAAGGGEVWVAAGTYNEARESYPHGHDGDWEWNTASVVMRPGVHVYGGFDGTETDRDQRDWDQSETVIDGSTALLGTGPARHVVLGSDLATLDGFRVSGGQARGGDQRSNGGGVYNGGAAPVVANCIFTNNSAAGDGGAVYTYLASAAPTFSACVFRNNSATGSGGAMGTYTSSPSVVNCLFQANSAATGGAFFATGAGDPSLLNCTLYGNSATASGAATRSAGGAELLVQNCIVWDGAGCVSTEIGSYTLVTYSDVQGGNAGTGNLSGDPLFASTTLSDFRLQTGSPCINAGTSANAPETDLRYAARPQGSGVDMGAYEYIEAGGSGPVEAASGIGTDGGTVVVDRPESPIVHASIEIDPGEVSSNVRFYLAVPATRPAAPASFGYSGSGVEVGTDSAVNENAVVGLVDVPYNASLSGDPSRILVGILDDQGQKIVGVATVVGWDTTNHVLHVLAYVPGTFVPLYELAGKSGAKAAGDIGTDFDVFLDFLPTDNTSCPACAQTPAYPSGIGYGASAFSQWYFGELRSLDGSLTQNHTYAAIYDLAQPAVNRNACGLIAACNTQTEVLRVVQELVDRGGGYALTATDADIKWQLRSALLATRAPVLLGMDTNGVTSTGHAVLVCGWNEAGQYFVVEDPNFPGEAGHRLQWNGTGFNAYVSGASYTNFFIVTPVASSFGDALHSAVAASKPAAGATLDSNFNKTVGIDVSLSTDGASTRWPAAQSTLEYRVNWGDGTTYETPADPSSMSHTYDTAGAYTIDVIVKDQDLMADRVQLQIVTGIGAGQSETLTLPGNVPLDMVWCPPGTYMMGRYAGEQDSFSDESAQHQVTLTKGLWLGKYEITQAQWKAVMGSNPSTFQGDAYGNTDNRPVETVSWNDVQTFITSLKALLPGKDFRLPTEAEWEYACRAGNRVPPVRYYWGNDSSYAQIVDYAWYTSNSSAQTHDVGGKTANAWGLFDMSGNVWEWCEDDYHATYTASAPGDGSAWVGSPRGTYRQRRGGGWNNYGLACRSAYRGSDTPAWTANTLGFRLAR